MQQSLPVAVEPHYQTIVRRL